MLIPLLTAEGVGNTFMYQLCTPVHQWLEAVTTREQLAMEWCQHRFSDHTSSLESFSLPCGIPGKVVSEKLGHTSNLWGHPNAAQNRAGL